MIITDLQIFKFQTENQKPRLQMFKPTMDQKPSKFDKKRWNSVESSEL